MAVMQSVLPLDASCEDLEIDASLSFLDGFVSEALAKGASAYKPTHLRTPTKHKPPRKCEKVYTVHVYDLLTVL